MRVVKKEFNYCICLFMMCFQFFSASRICFHFIPGDEVYRMDINWRSVNLRSVCQFSTTRKLFQNKIFLCINFVCEPTEQS